jgi:hypothetical protein
MTYVPIQNAIKNHTLKHKNVNFSLCLFMYHTMKTYDGVEAWLQASLTYELDGGD